MTARFSTRKGLDPQPDWTMEELLRELDAIQAWFLQPPLTSPPPPQEQPSSVGRVFGCRDLLEVADFDLSPNPEDDHSNRKSSRPFAIRAYDSDNSDSDSDDFEEKINPEPRSGELDIQEQVSESPAKNLERQALGSPMAVSRNRVLESSLFELEQKRLLRVQQEIRERLKVAQQDLEAETDRSAEALLMIENNEQMQRNLAQRVDKQYQRKIAEARDTHISAVQRDHQQRSQIQERRIKNEAREAEEAKRAEMEKIRAAQEHKRKAEAAAEAERKKAAEEAQRKQAEAEKRALEEARGKEIELQAQKEAAAAAQKKEKELQSQKNAAETKSGSEIQVKVAPEAEKIEAQRVGVLKQLRSEFGSLRSNADLSKELKAAEKAISKKVLQMGGTLQQARLKAGELIKIFSGGRYNGQCLFTRFSAKIVSQCESKNMDLNTLAFGQAHVIVFVSSQLPLVMDVVLGELYSECIFTVPKFILFSKGYFGTKEAYFRALGYKEINGKLEETDQYLDRMRAYVTLYAAITQTEIQGFANPHGLKYAWTWLARFLNHLPANRITLAMLVTFLKICGYRLFRTYPKPFRIVLKLIEREFIPCLESDREASCDVTALKTYLMCEAYKEEPVGLRLPETDNSETVRA